MRAARGRIWRTSVASIALMGLIQAPIAWADADATFKAGLTALEEGRFPDALRKADDGYAEKKQARFVLLKALTLEKMGRIQEAWQLIQLVLPRDLPSALHGEFASSYERLEKAAAAEPAQRAEAERVAKAAQDARAQQLAEEQLRRDARASRATVLWIAAGSLAGAGAAATGWGWYTANAASQLDLVKPTTHADYRSQMSLGRTLYWSGIGAIGVGLALGGWALAESKSAAPTLAPQAAKWRLFPAVGAGEVGLQLTGGF